MLNIVGSRHFVEIPGEGSVELPPLLVSDGVNTRRLDKVVNLASHLVEKEDLVPSVAMDHVVPDADRERRKFDMALNLVDMYLALKRHWSWGDGIVEWIRQCEITFEAKADLRRLLHPDVWPHAGRSSFVTLLEDKAVSIDGINIEKAVGLRLTYRHLPPLSDFSDQYLFYLNKTLAGAAYQTWCQMTPAPVSALPPERFHVQVVTM